MRNFFRTFLMGLALCSIVCNAAECGNNICESDENKLICWRDCGINLPPYTAKIQNQLSHQNRARYYSLYLPSCYRQGTPIPLVFNIHGGGGTGEAAEIGIGGMNKKAEEECFLAVYPNAVSHIGVPGRRQYWNAGDRLDLPFINREIDDMGFFSALLDELMAKYTIDHGRVHAIGISNGAWMAEALACKLSTRIASVSSAAGSVMGLDCEPTRPVSLLHFHGTQDPGWPFAGGNSCFTSSRRPAVSEMLKEWLLRNKCKEPGHISLKKGAATCTSYACSKETEVTLCVAEGAGHTYPSGYTFPIERAVKWDNDCALGSGRGVGSVSHNISALDVSWDFFKRHPLK